MNLDDIDRQKSSGREPMQLELRLGEQGEARGNRRSVGISTAVHEHESSGQAMRWDYRTLEGRAVKFLNRRMRTRMSGGVGGD